MASVVLLPTESFVMWCLALSVFSILPFAILAYVQTPDSHQLPESSAQYQMPKSASEHVADEKSEPNDVLLRSS